jgi:predicted HD phosphohydrolase
MLDRPRQTLRVVAAGASADTRHALRTAEILRELGADPELVHAGLLHDVAKPAGTALWHRIASHS